MISPKRIRQAFDAAFRGAESRKYISGLMGVKTTAGNYVFSDPQAGFVRVRFSANGTLLPGRARNDAGVEHRANLPIQLFYDQNNTLVIAGIDHTGGKADAATGDDVGNPYGVKVHNHGIGSGDLQYVHPGLLQERGRVYSAGGMLVTIAAFRYYYNGAWETWEGGNLDLTAYKPGTAGHHAWVLVGINPATNTAVAVTGSSIVYATALTYADLDAIAFVDYIPCGAVDVRDDDTALTDVADYVDAHNWFGQGATLFTELDDVDQDYTGDAGKLVQVNATEDGLEFMELGAKIAAATEKTTPVDADNLALADSAASNVLKRLTWANLKAYFDSLYLVLAGVAGGQTAYGGTAANENMTIEGTSHATKGPVLLNPSGGNVGIGGTPDSTRKLHIQGIGQASMMMQTSDNTTASFAGAIVINDDDTIIGNLLAHAAARTVTRCGVALGGLIEILASGAGITGLLINTNTAYPLIFGTNNIERMRILSSGEIGIGVTAPQGRLHAHDGTGGWLKKSFTSQTFASRVAVIPNGTGDMLYVCTGTVAVRASDGTYATKSLVAGGGQLIPGGSVTIYDDGFGTNTLLLEGLDTAGANNGAISIRRSAGSLSYIVSLDIHWL